jgi:hypothetical protein
VGILLTCFHFARARLIGGLKAKHGLAATSP